MLSQLAARLRIPKLNNHQRLTLIFGLLFVILAILLFYPMQQIFAGNWILKQGFSFQVFEPDPTVNSVFNGVVTIRFYALSILTGLISGYVLALHLARKHFVATTVIDRLLIGMVIFGLIGARLFFVLFNLDSFDLQGQSDNTYLDLLRFNFWEQVISVQQGGLSFFGMLISCTTYLFLYCKRFKFSYFEFLDILILPLLIGQIFGRFGNFFNYESYGGPTSVFWKMFVPDNVNFYESINQKFFHPTFLYEIIPNIFLFLLLMWHYDDLTKKRSGLVFAFYAIGYGTIRFFTEFFRIDALFVKLPEAYHLAISNITIDRLLVSQITALLLVGCGMYIYNTRIKIIYLKKTMVELKTKKRQRSFFN